MAKVLDPQQLLYMKAVLGIDRVLMPETATTTVAGLGDATAIQGAVAIKGDVLSARLVALVASPTSESVLTGEADSLAEKMVLAMKLKRQEVAWIEWRNAATEPCPDEVIEAALSSHVPILCFGAEAAGSLLQASAIPGQWIDWSGVRLMVTHSLSELLSQPEKKKSAWAHLQAVMKIL